MEKKLLEKYNEDGYIILKKNFTEELCSKLIDWLNNEKVEKSYNLENNIATIYQNLLTNSSPYHDVINNTEIKKTLKLIFGNDKFCFNMIKVNNKTKYSGKDIEFHQEYYNQHFLHKNNKPENYLQIFIPLNNHNPNNGCLKIIPKSHKLGFLKYEEFLDTDLNHKYRVPGSLLDNLNEEIFNCELEAGDVLIFNSLLIHGSNSNKSKLNRLAIVSHIAKSDLELDQEEIKKHYEYRKKFEINYLKSQILDKERKIKDKNHVHKFN